MKDGRIAVIDVGKTNVKLALVDPATLQETDVATCPNRVLPGPPWPHFDTDAIGDFLLEALADFGARESIAAISVTTHGAACAMIGADGKLAAPVLDYEFDGPDALAAAYDAIRPDFAETGSPRLGMGLNLGAQLHWQFENDPGLRERIRHVVTYPQYWGYLLTGQVACDVTSLGCHTDLWAPFRGRLSGLAERLGIAARLAPVRRPDAVLGQILPDVAARTGLRADTPVLCGIHDSNASLLAHLRAHEPPFSVVSTGTWVIAMAMGGSPVTLDPARDTLVNVNAFGAPAPSARFMGGREYEILTGGAPGTPEAVEIDAVLRGGPMFLPALVEGSGPFRGQNGCWIGAEPAAGSGEREVAVAFYLAMVTAHCLSLVGHRGAVHVEGPFARNRCYLEMLAAGTGSVVHATASATGTSRGAALLAAPDAEIPGPGPAIRGSPRHAEYARRWNAALAGRAKGRALSR